jgi:hypothetical protein
MSSRPLTGPTVLANAVSMSSSVATKPLIIQMESMAAFSLVWTGSPVGTFALETSDDYSLDASGEVKNAGTWNALPLSETPTAAGTSGNDFINASSLAGYAVRVKYNYTSGTGSLTVVANAKVA